MFRSRWRQQKAAGKPSHETAYYQQQPQKNPEIQKRTWAKKSGQDRFLLIVDITSNGFCSKDGALWTGHLFTRFPYDSAA